MGVDGKVFVVSSGELLVISEMILSLMVRMTVPLMVPLPLKVALMVPLMVLMMNFAVMASILIPSQPQMISFIRPKMHILPKITFIH